MACKWCFNHIFFGSKWKHPSAQLKKYKGIEKKVLLSGIQIYENSKANNDMKIYIYPKDR